MLPKNFHKVGIKAYTFIIIIMLVSNYGISCTMRSREMEFTQKSTVIL